MANPALVSSSLSLSSTLDIPWNNNHINYEETGGLNFGADEKETKDQESLRKNFHINVTNIAYFPHNDTLIAAYNCVIKGNEESLRWSQTKEISQYSTCTFEKQNVGFQFMFLFYLIKNYDVSSFLLNDFKP